MTTENQIIQGDCVSILKTLPSGSVDFVLTDPPYGISYRDSLNRTIQNDDCLDNILGCFTDLYRVLKPDSFCVSFYGYSKVDKFFDAWLQAGFKPAGHIVWPKKYSASTKGFLQTRHEVAYLLVKGRPARPADPLPDVMPWEYTGNKIHPTEKAVSVLTPLIKSFSNPGDLVLDPFSGSGSTSVAAALSGRRYLGIELDAEYCEAARRRLDGVACYMQQKIA